MKPENDDEQLARLTERTSKLAPHAGFADRVMLAVGKQPLPKQRERVFALGLFAAAAAAAMLLSFGAQTTLDQRAISAFDVVELEP
jgi:hypothetical protein